MDNMCLDGLERRNMVRTVCYFAPMVLKGGKDVIISALCKTWHQTDAEEHCTVLGMKTRLSYVWSRGMRGPASC